MSLLNATYKKGNGLESFKQVEQHLLVAGCEKDGCCWREKNRRLFSLVQGKKQQALKDKSNKH